MSASVPHLSSRGHAAGRADPRGDSAPRQAAGLQPRCNITVGRKPERQAETIPGGVRPDDERIAAHSTQTGAVPTDDGTPSGHREGRAADDDLVREAGENR